MGPLLMDYYIVFHVRSLKHNCYLVRCNYALLICALTVKLLFLCKSNNKHRFITKNNQLMSSPVHKKNNGYIFIQFFIISLLTIMTSQYFFNFRFFYTFFSPLPIEGQHLAFFSSISYYILSNFYIAVYFLF